MPATTNFALPYPALADPADVPADIQALAAKLDLLKLAAGTEIGYDQITAQVNVTSGTEAAGTVIIAAAAHAFDGAPVIAEFFAPSIFIGSADYVIVCLFEGATEIGRLIDVRAPIGSALSTGGLSGKLRFTPSVGNHTYTVTAHRAAANGGIVAGTGAIGFVPAYLRFTKV